MKRKIYKPLPGAKQGLFALALTVFSGAVSSQNTYTFNYTGSQQSINLQAGTYTIETWGADGGDNLGNGSTTYLQNGGKGGYSVGTYTLASAATIYVHVGGKGVASTTVLSTTVAGGYNGGGYGSLNTTSGKCSGAGGGGASHVATATGTLGALSGNQSAVIIVGGGGGGAGESNYASNNTSYNANGGNGGGASGLQIVSTVYQGRHGKGGTQTAGGTGGDNGSAVAGPPLQGIFGAGGYNNISGNNTSVGGAGIGGGGGGWYGGGAGWGGAATSYCAGAGGGGSGYIGGVTNATTTTSGTTGFVTNPDVSGNGYVRIKEACSITLSVTGINSNNAICAGNSVTLTTNGVSNYSWSTGATSSSLVVSPAITTVYSLTAMSPSNCTSSSSFTVFVNSAIPSLTVANTANSGGICPTKTVMLTASGATTYTWTGGSTSVTNGIAFAPTVPSTYVVTGGNACGTATAATSISVHPLPNVTATSSSPSLCAGSSLTLTAVGNATAYAWFGASGITNGVGFVPSTSTEYTLVGTSALSCTAAATVSVPVFASPNIPPIAQPALICIGNSSTLTATGAAGYTWTGGSSTGNNGTYVVTPSSPGISTYTVLRSNSTCTTTAQITVVTNSLPVAFAIVSGPTLVCASTAVTLAVAGGQTYTWTSPGNPPIVPSFSFTGANPVVFPPVNTVYTVAAHDGTCVNTATVAVGTNPNPTLVTTASPSMICQGEVVTVSVTGGNTYTWTSTSTTIPPSSASFTDMPLIATAYNVTGDNSFGCTASAQQIVLVNTSPTLAASVVANKTLVCNGGTSSLTASGADSYTWSGGSASGSNTLVVVTSTNTSSGPVVYTISGTSTLTQCSSSKTIAVNVFIPNLSISGSTITCPGGPISLNVSGGNNGWNWQYPGGSSGFSTLNTNISAAAVFTVSANTTSASISCLGSKTIAVDVYPLPPIAAVAQRTTICVKESVVLTASGGTAYVWSNNLAQTATISVSPNNNTNYTVTGTDLNGCANTGTVAVKVLGCTGINELGANSGLNIYPNPNSGEFFIQSNSDAKLTLVNELGQMVRTLILSGSNNYKVQIIDIAQGVYFLNGEKDGSIINQKIIVTK